ncbi:MAG: diguanylate cyclase, partial [Xanthobacteraceae bacterium]
LRLVALAGIVCVITSLVTVNLIQRAHQSKDRSRCIWIAAAGLAGGCGIWATHFIAMLAYQPGFPVAYNVILTGLSLVCAAVLVAAGVAIAVVLPARLGSLLGGAVIGIAIGSMHYLGMSALEVPGRLTWSIDLVSYSLAFGIGFAIAAIYLAKQSADVAMTFAASLALSAAILGLHFTAMGAVGIEPDPRIVVTPSAIDPSVLALFIAAATTLVLAIGAVGLFVDQRMREKSDQLAAALHNMSQGLCMLNRDFQVVVVNDRFLEMFGIAPERIAPRMPMHSLMDLAEESVPIAGEGRLAVRHWAQALVREQKSGKTIFTRIDGRIFCITHEQMPSTGGWVETFEDVTERRQAEDKIAHMARHDSLTGLPNRTHFREQLEKSLVSLDRGDIIGVLCLDLDRFKVVNDTLGHHSGDRLLQIAAERLRGALRESDFIGRISGDEFSVLQIARDQPTAVTALARRLVEVMSAPFLIGDHQVQVGVSVGISLAPADGNEADQLLKNADLALYRAKA